MLVTPSLERSVQPYGPLMLLIYGSLAAAASDAIMLQSYGEWLSAWKRSVLAWQGELMTVLPSYVHAISSAASLTQVMLAYSSLQRTTRVLLGEVVIAPRAPAHRHSHLVYTSWHRSESKSLVGCTRVSNGRHAGRMSHKRLLQLRFGFALTIRRQKE